MTAWSAVVWASCVTADLPCDDTAEIDLALPLGIMITAVAALAAFAIVTAVRHRRSR